MVRLGWYMQKIPRPLAFTQHVETEVIDAQKMRGVTLNGRPDTLLVSHQWRNPPSNVEDNLCAEHLVIEDWFGGY